MMPSEHSLAQQKRQLRQQIRRLRQNIPARERKKAEKTIICRLKPLIKRHHKIGLYWAIGSELDLSPLFQTALQRQAQIYLPYLEPHTLRMWFTPYTPNARPQRRFSKQKIQIPQFAGKKIRAQWLNSLIIPLVGIDRAGYRLGQGGGYYDASLSTHRFSRVSKIGAGFACQLLDHLPHETHDKKLDYFVSEQHYLKFSRE